MTTDDDILRSDKRIRERIGQDPEKEDAKINWAELHDALTSLRAHGKPIYEALTATDLDDINARVRCLPSWHLVQPARTCSLL